MGKHKRKHKNKNKQQNQQNQPKEISVFRLDLLLWRQENKGKRRLIKIQPPTIIVPNQLALPAPKTDINAEREGVGARLIERIRNWRQEKGKDFWNDETVSKILGTNNMIEAKCWLCKEDIVTASKIGVIKRILGVHIQGKHSITNAEHLADLIDLSIANSRIVTFLPKSPSDQEIPNPWSGGWEYI